MTSCASDGYPLTREQGKLLDIICNTNMMGFHQELKAQFECPKLYTDISFEERLIRCFDSQAQFESTQRFNKMYKLSGIRQKHYIREFQPDAARGLDVEFLRILQESSFITNGCNIIIIGATGTGKTCLANAAGIEAISKGFRVRFYRMSDLIMQLDAMSPLSFGRFKQRIKNIDLLILDDYGLTTFSDKVAICLNEIADIRYGKGSTIFTTQLKRNALKKIIDKSAMADALADRWFRRSDYEITLSGETWRGSDKEFK